MVIPNPTRDISRKVRNGKMIVEDCTSIYMGQPIAVPMPKAAVNSTFISYERVSVFNRLSYLNEMRPTTHQHHKTSEDDFNLKFVPGAVIGSTKSKSRNARKRAAKRVRAATSGTHTVNAITRSSPIEVFANHTPFKMLKHDGSCSRVARKAPIPQSINVTGGKRLSTATHQAFQQGKAIQHTPQGCSTRRKAPSSKSWRRQSYPGRCFHSRKCKAFKILCVSRPVISNKW